MVLSITSTSPLLPHLTPPSFSQTLTHVRLYHPSILLHMHRVFLLPPPPISYTAKFYSVFTPFVQRERKETESLVFNASQETNNGTVMDGETVLEIVVRSTGLRKGVERELEGWKEGVGSCHLNQLESLASCFAAHGPSAISQKASNAVLGFQSLLISLPAILGSNQEPLVQPEPHNGATRISCTSATSICTYRYLVL